MGWKGALRSIAAAQRAAERERSRQQRHFERIAKEEAKAAALRQAEHAVYEYEKLIRRLTSVHRRCGNAWDWNKHATAPDLPEPAPQSVREQAAQRALDRYSPNWLDKVFRRSGKQRALLIERLNIAKDDDARDNVQAREQHAKAAKDLEELRELAKKILANDVSAFRDATDELGPFREIAELGSYVEFKFYDGARASVRLFVNEESVIPSDSLSLLQSGKLSVKKMPQGKRMDIYQDYVAGAVLRIARELFALLPLKVVLVTAVSKMLDAATGNLADQAILSVMIPRSTLETLNFEALDASDSMRNFQHRMEFKKSVGFQPIQQLEFEISGSDGLSVGDAVSIQ